MIYTVYILFSHKDENLYVGCSNDVQRRLVRHNQGFVEATKQRRPLVLIHQEIFTEKEKAFNRERFLKSLWGSREKQYIKKKYLDSVNH